MWILELFRRNAEMECWRNGVLDKRNNTKQEQYSSTPVLQYSKKNSGFTLIEILIAIFIFAVVLTTIYTSYTGTFRIVDDTESQAEIYRMARIALERMLEDLESVYILKNPETGRPEESHRPSQFVGEDMEIKGRYADTLRFTSRAHINLSGEEQDPGTVEIGYYVKENDEGDDFVLYRSERPVFEEAFPAEEETGGLVLCERLVSVNFTYHEENGEVRESWDSASDAFKDKLPKMVSISLEFVNDSDPEAPFRFMTSVAFPIEQEYSW
jgi:prepilin-type N-terminal cleavage/methylation domain-containing protein